MRVSTKTEKRPRGRPREYDPTVALGQLSQTFQTHGYSGTSLDDLAEASGMNRPSLYAAFGDKKAMYLAALRATRDSVRDKLASLAKVDLPLRDKIEKVLLATVDVYWEGRRGCTVVSTATAEALSDPDIAKELQGFIDTVDAAIADMLTRANHPNPLGVARMVSAVIQSLSIRVRAGAPRAQLEKLARDTASTLFERR